MRSRVDSLKLAALFCLVLLPLLGATALAAEDRSSWSFHSELDLYLSLKAGAEYQFSDHFGIRGSLGACIISPAQFSYTLIGISHLSKPDSGLQFDIQYGLIQAIFDVIDADNRYAYWVPGVCAAIGYRSPRGHRFAMRAGGGIGLGYDLGAWRAPNLMPNLALEYGWRKP
jgi:hypothetical protein